MKARELLICLFFLRPAVDAYRVSTHHIDSEATFDTLNEMMSNKAIELGTESIPGCVLQIFVFLQNPEKAGIGALVSIAISALTTGYTSALMSFDLDLDVHHRRCEPRFYGYVPDDHATRGRCFMLMALMSALHNFSRSVGCALLAVSGGKTMVLLFVGGEMLLYLLWKVLRQDFLYWIRLDGFLGFTVSLVNRILVKIIVDFSGCIQFRHPNEMGGVAFSLSMVFAQAMPFVALLMFEEDMENGVSSRENIMYFLLCCLGGWLVANVLFFSTIDLTFLDTFFGTKTASQYTCLRYHINDKNEEARFDAVFVNRISYTKSIHEEVQKWVADNIERWKEEKPDWFDIGAIPDDMLPSALFLSIGGLNRRRPSISDAMSMRRNSFSAMEEA